LKTMFLKILILGGTNFLGPHLVEELQERGHEVSLFNRGTQDPSLFSYVEMLRGDRDGNLDALKNRWWDAIIDTSGHLPRIVEASSQILSTHTNHYTFISTIGVYDDFHSSPIDENYPLAQLEDKTIEEINDNTYGGLKAACEKVVAQYFSDRFLVIRPGLIVGPRDPTHRFSYWPLRIAEGGEVLAPVSPELPLQFIDVRDLAKWVVSMVEKRATGVYNATGPALPLKFEELLTTCSHVCNNPVTLTWVSEDFLNLHDVQDWTELPLWFSTNRNRPGFYHIDVRKAIQAGLTFRPLSETILATLDWDRKHPSQVGLDRTKEQALLKKWNAKL
jgi:2'-hydroxyisoflavone reductase